MKKKTLYRAFAILCLMSVLAACAREAAPPEAPPSELTETETREEWESALEECRRLTLNSIKQNWSRLRMYDVLSLDPEVFFADYTGGPTQTVEYTPEGWGGVPLSNPRLTNAVYYWHDEDELRKTATPKKGAQELTSVMLAHLQSLPDDERDFTITDFSVEGDLQIPRTWESIVDEVFAHSIAGPNYTGEEAIAVLKSYLAKETAKDEPFDYPSCGYALGENMWALEPSFKAEYDGDEPRRRQNDSGEETFIIMRDGDVWRMQRADAMEQMFADAPFIQRMGGYTLSQLEHSMIEGGREYYIESANAEYLRRLELEPEEMYERMDALGFPHLTYLCRMLSYEATPSGFEPEGDSYSAELLRKYIELEKSRKGEAEHVIPPATGVLCPALLFDELKTGHETQLCYASDELLVFTASSGVAGVFAYDFGKEQLVFSADLLTAMGLTWTRSGLGEMVCTLVDADGGRIRLAYTEEGWDHYLVRYEIDTGDWGWEFVNYELPIDDTEGIFTLDPDSGGYGELACKPEDGWVSEYLRDLVYIRGDETVRLFDGVSFGAAPQSAPVPSKDLEQSIHHVIMALGSDYGDFECEAHETLCAETLANGDVKCCLAAARGGYSRAAGSIVQGSGSLSYYALTFTPDKNGYYVFTEKDDVNGPWSEEISRIFPSSLRGRVNDPELEQKLWDSCISQAMEHFGLEPDSGEQT